MGFEVKENVDDITITAKGDINLYTSKDLKNLLLDITKTGEKHIIVDFSQVDYMDSAGIGVLISVYKIQEKKGKKLIIRKPNADIVNFIRLAGLSDILGV